MQELRARPASQHGNAVALRIETHTILSAVVFANGHKFVEFLTRILERFPCIKSWTAEHSDVHHPKYAAVIVQREPNHASTPRVITKFTVVPHTAQVHFAEATIGDSCSHTALSVRVCHF